MSASKFWINSVDSRYPLPEHWWQEGHPVKWYGGWAIGITGFVGFFTVVWFLDRSDDETATRLFQDQCVAAGGHVIDYASDDKACIAGNGSSLLFKYTEIRERVMSGG